MYVSWSIPDSYVKLANQDNADKISGIIKHMEACLCEAIASLYLYKSFDRNADYMQGRWKFHFPLVAAKSFVTNVDLYFKSLKRIEDIQKDNSIKPLIESFEKHFPDLKGVRDSIQHADERMINKAGKKDIIPDGGIMYNSNILNIGTEDNLQFTKSDGKPGYVEISVKSLEHIRDNLVLLCAKFDWL